MNSNFIRVFKMIMFSGIRSYISSSRLCALILQLRVTSFYIW